MKEKKLTIEDIRERIEKISIYDPEELTYIWNDTEISSKEERIHMMEDFDEYSDEMTPTELLESLDRDFDIRDDFFRKDVFQRFESTSCLDDWIEDDELEEIASEIYSYYECDGKWSYTFSKLLDTIESEKEEKI